MLLDDDELRARLAPAPRRWEELAGHRHAAVLAGVIRIGGVDRLIFTQRQADLPEHPGQVSFPGGAREGDEDPVACALRESREEIGVCPESVVVLGSLENRTSTSTYRVHSLVGRVVADFDTLRPDPREVATLFHVALAELLDESRWEDRPYEADGRRYRRSPHFIHEDQVIWGLTGRLTRDLISMIRE